jgi:hypothetical protein
MAEFVCGRCGHEFCPECVVFPYGVDKPPVCIECGLQMAGVSKRPTGRPKLNRRTIKRRLKEQKRAATPQQSPAEIEVDLEEPPAYDEERWMHGTTDPDDLPGGWKQTF